jgi:hypothetical protein
MPAIGGIILNQVVSVLANKALSMLFATPDTTYERLSEFLEKLSRNFVTQVEEAIRNAFLENRFDDIKATILLAHETLARYQKTKVTKPPHGDKSILNTAKHDIDKVYTQLKTQIDKILAVENNPPCEPHIRIKSYLKLTELTLLALQVLVPIDVLISIEYVDLHDTYKETIIRRIKEYTTYADRLLALYQRHQPLRVRQKEKSLYWPKAFEDDYQRFKSVWPSRNHIENNSTYWIYLIEGEVPINVQLARQPTDYMGYQVTYSCQYGEKPILIKVAADKARNEPNVAKDQFITELSRLALKDLKPQIESAKTIWNEAKEKILYAEAYNYLIDITENKNEEEIKALADSIKPSFNRLSQSDKNTLFCRSVRLGKGNLARCYLQEGASRDALDDEAKQLDENILFIAVRSGSVDMVNLILENFSDLDKKNKARKSATQIAKELNPQVAKILEQRRFIALMTTYSNIPAFHDKLQQLDLTLVDLNYRQPPSGDTLLHKMLRATDPNAKPLMMNGASLFIANNLGETPEKIATSSKDSRLHNLKGDLFLASARALNIDTLTECLNHGVDINYVDPVSGNSALHEVYKGRDGTEREEMIRFLFTQGIDIVRNNYRLIPQQKDIYNKASDPALIKSFIDQVSRGNLPNSYTSLCVEDLRSFRAEATEDTVLHLIVRSNLSQQNGCKLIAYLCGAFATNYEVDEFSFVKNKQGLTAKKLAQQRNKPELAAALSKEQLTPLFRALNYQKLEGLKLFVSDNPNLNVLIKARRQTPLNFVICNLIYPHNLKASLAIIAYLVSTGADVNIRVDNTPSAMETIRSLSRSWQGYTASYPAYSEALRILKQADKESSLIENLHDRYLIKINDLSRWDLLFMASLFFLWKTFPTQLLQQEQGRTIGLEFVRNLAKHFTPPTASLILLCFVCLITLYSLYRCTVDQSELAVPRLG